MDVTPTTTAGDGGAGHRVVFADDDAAALLGGALDVLARPAENGWEVVKTNPSRTVYRGRIGQAELFVKHFHRRSGLRAVLRFLGRSDCRRELALTRYLQAAGVATVPVLAARIGAEPEYLVSRAVWPSQPAEQWHAQQRAAGEAGARQVQKAIVALGNLLARMHAAGVVHHDLHCGNVLVRTDTDEPEPVLMDLHRASRRRRLSRRAMTLNLAQLFHDRHNFTTRTERLRFLACYLRAGNAPGTLRGWEFLVSYFGWRHRLKQYRHRDRRIFGRNKYFAPLEFGDGWRGHVVLGSKRALGGSKAAQCTFTEDDWREALADPPSLLSGSDVEVVKSSRSALVVRRKLTVGANTIDVYVKRFARKRRWKVFFDRFRRARPIRAFHLGHRLLTRWMATALPMAALEQRNGSALVDNLLITEAVDVPRLDEFLQRWLARPAQGDAALTAAQQRRLAQEVLWQMGRLLQRLHDNGFAHRDLKAGNMLVRWKRDEEPELVLVDLDGLKKVWCVTARRRFQGLMRLNVSLLQCPVVNHAGRLRMLLGYLRRPGSGRINFKPCWRVLEDWSARKLRQQIRSRRRRQREARRPTG